MSFGVIRKYQNGGLLGIIRLPQNIKYKYSVTSCLLKIAYYFCTHIAGWSSW